MPGSITIELKGLRFFAYHGLYAEEQKTGNEFEIDLFVTHQPSKIQSKEFQKRSTMLICLRSSGRKWKHPENCWKHLSCKSPRLSMKNFQG